MSLLFYYRVHRLPHSEIVGKIRLIQISYKKPYYACPEYWSFVREESITCDLFNNLMIMTTQAAKHSYGVLQIDDSLSLSPCP